MAQAGEVFINFGANTQGLLTGTARAGNILKRFSETGAGAAVVLGASFVTVSRTVANFANSAVQGFKDFDFEMNRAKALSGSTETEFKKLTFAASELGRVTEYTAREAAEGMANLALAGFNAGEILEAIPQSLRLATAGGVGLAKTNTIMANAIRGFRLEADQANQVANVLTATFTTTNTTLESLAQTFKTATGPLSLVGVKMEEVASAAGILGDVGITASVAGTGLKNFGIKLAKTFGVDMEKANESAKEFFETLGVTKDKIFDAKTGVFDMVKAAIAFKDAMDQMGESRAPEFLGEFATLFGERNAVSLSALVKDAEKFKIQSRQIRMTEMVGDIQKVFEQMQGLGSNTLYMTKQQEGFTESVKKMVGYLDNSESIMEEFMEGGKGANGAIERMAKNFEDVEKIMKKTFGDDGGKVLSKTADGLLEIIAYSKKNADEMDRYDNILSELADKSITGNRRKELEEEKNATYALISANKKSVEDLTVLGRTRMVQLVTNLEYIKSLEASADGTSKSINQLKELSRTFKGNEDNIVLAAQALGIHIDKNVKLDGTLGKVRDKMLKTTMSIDAQKYAMSQLVAQSALVNTAWDMQRTQLNTLSGSIEILQSNLETLSNKIAKALAPALDAALKSGAELLKAFTLSNDEMERGVTASELFADSWRKVFQIFNQNGGIFYELSKSFEGLSSWGKSAAAMVGLLGAAGIAAGGAFIWVQALMPAIGALAGTFTTIVLPLTLIISLTTKFGIELNKAKERLKEIGDIGGKSIQGIVKTYNDLKDVAGDVNGKITESEATIMKVYTNLSEKLKVVRSGYDSIIERLDQLTGRTQKLSVIGGNFVLFKKSVSNDIVSAQESIVDLYQSLLKIDGISEQGAKSLANAVRMGDFSEVNKILANTDGLLDAVVSSGAKLTLFGGVANEAIRFEDVLRGISKDSINVKQELGDAFKSGNIMEVFSALTKTESALKNLVGMGASMNVVDNGSILSTTESVNRFNDVLNKSANRMGIAKKSITSFLNAYKNNDIRQINELLQDNSNLMQALSEDGIKIQFMNSDQSSRIFNVVNASKELKKVLGQIPNVSATVKDELQNAFDTNNISEFNKLLSEHKNLSDAITASKMTVGLIGRSSIGDALSMNDSLKVIEESLRGVNGLSKEVSDGFIKAFERRDALEMNKLMRENEGILKVLAKSGYAAGFATENQKRELQGLNEMLDEARKKKADLTKQQESMGDGGANEEQRRDLSQQIADTESQIADFQERQSRTYSKIIGNKGVIGKLTSKELKDLTELEYKIKAQKNAFYPLKQQYDDILKKIKEGTLGEDDRKKAIEDANSLYKEMEESHSRLSDSQRRYNKILNDASDKNPFMSLLRYAKDLSNSPEVLKFMAQVASVTDKIFSNVITGVEKALPIITVAWESFFKAANKFIKEIWPGLKAVAGSMWNLFISVFDALGRTFIKTFDALGSDSNDAFKILRDVLLKIAEWINNIADAIKNLDTGKIKNIAIAFAGVWAGLKMFEGAGAIVGGLTGTFGTLSGSAKQFNKTLDGIKNTLLDIYTDPSNGQWISSLEQGAKNIGNMTKKSKAVKSFQGAGQKASDLGGMLGNIMPNSLKKINLNPLSMIKGGAKGTGEAFKKVIGDGLLGGFAAASGKASVALGNVGKNSGMLGKAGGLLLAPLSMATGVMSSLSGAMAAIPGILVAAATALAPIIAAIAIAGALIAAIIYAFKHNVGGFRDMVMSLVALVVEKIGMLTAKFMGMAGKFIDMAKSVGERLAPIIAPIMVLIIKVVKSVISFVMDGIGLIMDFLGGLFEFIDGLATGNMSKILGGLIDMGESILQLVLKIFTFILELGAKVFGFFYGNSIKIVGWIVDLIAKGFEKIGLGWISDKMKKFAEGMGNLGNNVINSDEYVKGIGDMASKKIGSLAEIGRKKAGAETKADEERKAIEARAKKAKESATEKGNKSKESQDKQTQAMEVLAGKIGDMGDSAKKSIEARPNVINNTYVEYRAAEDDEVNRRMIERIMNDILKTDVGAMMGDTSSVG